MGNTQSAQKESKDAAAEQEGTESDGGVTEQDADKQPLKSSGNFSDTNWKADRNVAAYNGHFEDEITAMDEDFPKIAESIKEEDTQSEKEEICQEYSPDEVDSNENVQVEITEIEEKQNDINETLRKLFSNIKFKLTVKRGLTDNVEVATHLTEQDPKTTEDIKHMANETRNKNAKLTLDHNAAPDTHDTDSTTCPTLTDDTSDVLLESGEENSPETKEDIEADSADAVTVFSSREADEQKEPSGERWHSTASPNYNNEEEVTDSPFKSFFTTGIFSGLQKKKQLVNKQEREMEEITELAPQDLEQEYEITVGVEACPKDLVENEPKENIMCVPSPQLTDASPSISPSTYTVPVAEISSSQEDKVQASPLKRLLSGSSLKRLSRKPRSRRSSDGRLSSSGEHNSDHYLSSTESADSHNNENLTQSSEALKEDTSAWESFKKRMTPKKRRRKSSLNNEETYFIDAKDKGPQSKKLGNSTEDIADLWLSSAEAADNQKENSGAPVSTKASDEGSAWSSFKKLMTPKKLVKKPSSGNEEKLFLDEAEIKPSKDMPTSDHSTEEEEEEKRKELSVSWEAVLCGSGKKRSSKKSESEKPQIDAGTIKEDNRCAKSALEKSNEINKTLTQSPNQAESFPECDEGLTWKSFKKLVTPKRRAKHEDEAKDYKEPDSISTQEETFSLRKLLSGKKIRPCVEKQELSSEVDGKPTSGDDEESETPAVVPLSEFDTIETDILQTQANIERCNKSEAGNDIKEDLCEETPVQILSRNSEIEIENITKTEPLRMEISTDQSSNEESDENTDTSKHQQLSDIPEEGIITETMATPASVVDEVTKDDTTAEDLIEMTSEAITAPEPDDVSVTDETDMISAVSQFPESSKTSGNTTPVPVEHQEKDTEMLLQQAAETIVTSTSEVQICSEKTSPEGIVHSLWKQILKTFRNEKSMEDKTTIKMDLNEDAKDAFIAAKTMIDMNKDISKEIISGVPTEEFDLAEIANDDDVCQLQENCMESLIKRSEDSQNIDKYLEETNCKTTSIEPSLQVEVVISDNTEVAYQTEVQPSKTDSEKVQSAFTMTEKTQDRVIEPKPQDMAGTDTPILSNINEEARIETEEPIAQLEKKTELVSKIHSLEQTQTMKPKQEADNITDVKETLDMQAEVPNSEETNRQLSKTENPTGEEVSKEDLPSTNYKPLAKPHTEMSIDNEDKEPLTGNEDFDKVQKERSDYESILVLPVLEEKLSEDASTFQTDKNEDEKIILSEDDIKPAYDITRKPDETCSTQALQIEMFSNNKPEVEIIKCETKSLAEASVKHQVVLEVLEDVADTTLDSNAVCCELIETKTILEVISATDTNEMEVHTAANIRAEDTSETRHGQETQVLEAGKDTVLKIGAGASYVIETKEMYEIISTAETSKHAMEALAKLNVRPEVISEIRQTKEPEVSEDLEAPKFDSDICTSIIIKEQDISEDILAKQTVKEEKHKKHERTMMSQDILKDTTALKKEEEKNETTALHKSDNDQVFGPECDYGRELPKKNTTLNLEVARFQLLEKEITSIAVSDGDEKTHFTEDNIDPMETIEKQKVSETLPEISSHPEQIEKVEVSEVIKTWVIVGDGKALKTETNDDLVSGFKRQTAGEQDHSEAAVPAYVRDYEASELQHLKKDVIDTISKEFAVEDKTIPLTGGNGEQVNAIKTKEVLILDSDPNKFQLIKNEGFSDSIQTVEPAEKNVSLINGSGELVIPTKNESIQETKCEGVYVSILDSDPNNLQKSKMEDLFEVIQATQSTDEMVALTDGNVDPVRASKTGNVSILDFDPNSLQIIKNQELSDGSQTLTDGNGEQINSTKTENIQYSEVCEPPLALVSDSEHNSLQMVKNEKISESIQVKSANKIEALTDGSSKPTSIIKSKDVHELGECEAVSVLTSDSGQSKLSNINNENFFKVMQATQLAGETISLTDGNNERVSATKTKDVLILDMDSKTLQIIKNKELSDGIRPAELADKTLYLTADTGELLNATQTGEVQESEECGAAQMVKNDEKVALMEGNGKTFTDTKTENVKQPKVCEPRSALNIYLEFSKCVQTAEQANEMVHLTDVNSKEPEDSNVLSAIILDSDSKNTKMLKNNKFSEGIPATEPADKIVSLPDAIGEPGSTTISEDVQEEIKSESVSALNLDSDANNLQMIKNEDFSRGIQLAESAVKTKTLTDGYGEAVTATTTNNVSILDSKSNRYNIVKNENFFEGVQKASECTGETSTLTNVTGQRESAFKTDECEAAGETVSLTDDKDEQAVSTKNKDVQDQNQSKETSDSVLDLDLKNLQMVKNKDFREGIQATEPANEKIPQVDGNVKSGITSNIEELQEPKECEAPRKTLSLTDGKNEQVGSTKSKDVQEQNESKEISVLVLDSNPNNLQMVKNNDFRESIQTAEPPNETIAQTDSNGKPMIASNIKELQEPKECEGPYETVSLTDGKDEQEESTKRKHVQEQNYSINVSASILDSDPNNIQMVKPENETISQTDGNGKPMIAPNIEELQEPKECEAPCETVPLTDGKDEQVGSTKTKDVQEQNESKEISIFALHSEPNKLQIVRSENSYEITQSTEPVDETVTLTEGNGGPMIATYIKDVQEPKECEAAGEVVSLTDGKDEQVVSNKSKDAQEQNERKEISVFVLDSDPNNLQMVKNNDFRESIQAAEPANETIAQIDGTDKPVIPLNIEELQEPKVYEAPCETVSLTDGKDEQVGFTKRNDVQEQNESKEISIFVLHSEPNKLQIVRSENSYEVTQSTEPVDETVTLTEGNGGPMIATYIKDVQEPKDCEAAGEAVSLTDGKDEQLVSTKSKDVQEQNERKEISVFVLDSDPNNLQMVKNNDFRESFQAAEPANEAIAQIDGTDKPMIAPNIEELQEPKENEAAGEAVSLTDGKDEQVVSTKSKDVQEQNERKEISVLDSDPNNLQMVKNNDFRESIQAAEPANETIAQIDGTDKPVIALNIEELQEPKVCEAPCETVSLTDGKDEQVVSTKSQDVQEQNERKEISVLDSDSNNLQMVTNNDFRESIQAAEAANETIAQTDGNGKPVITYNIAELQEPKECEAAVETVSMTGGKDKKVVSTKTKNVQEQNENKKVSALVLDSEPNNLQLVKKGNFFECIQTTEAVDETVSINDGNDEPVSSNKTKDIQEQNGDKAVLASILDSGANKLKMIKNEGFREDMQVSDQADQVSALNEGNGEPVSATTTMNNQEQEECMLLTTLILDSESKSRQVVKNNVFSGGIQKIESAPERVIPTDGKGEFKSVSEFKIVQEPGLFEDEPGVLQDCIQTVETVEDETEPSTGNQLSIGPAEEPKKFKVVLATISDSEPSPLLIPREGTEEDLSVIKNKSKERPHNEPMNMMTELFQFIQEVSTAKKENKDQPKDEILPCPKSNDDEEEPSKTEHVQEILEVPPAIILDLKAECSEFPEKDMILKDVTGAKITFCDSAPFTEGSVQTPKHLKINIVQDQDIFKAVPVTILDLEPSSPQSVTINQGSEETLKSDLKEKTLSFMVDDIKPVQTPTVKDIEVVDVVEKATLKSQVIKYVSLSKHELKIEPEPQDNAQPVEETTTRHVKEEHLVQEADDLAVGLEVESYALPKKREEPANLTGKAVIEELKEKRAPNSSEIKSFQEFSEAAETIKPNSESITQSLKTKNTSQNIQEGQRSRDEIVQEETQTEIPIVLPSDERENLTKVEPNSTPTNAQLEATSAQETGQKKDALEINQAQITGSCSPDFKSKHEEEVESAHTKQTLHTNCMPSFTEESNISHVPENTASSEEIPEKCKDSGRRSTELTDDRILSEIEINSDKEKENRPQFVRIKTATEMPQYNTNDVIPDTLIEKLSEIQLPRIAGITGETAFQKMVETVTPSAPEPITQTAEEVREMVMMHVQSVEFDDIQKIQVQDKNHDTESARTVFEPTLEVGFKEINDICQETIGEVETLSATSEIKNKVIHGENNATFEEVVLTKDPPEEMHESDVDSFETPRKHVDTATDVSDQVEDENRGVEAVVEDNTKVFTEIHTEKPEDIVQTCETPQSSDNFIHDEVLEETKANKAKYEVDASAETTTCPSKKTDIQKLQTVDSSASHSIGSEVVSQNTGVIPTVFIEPKPSFPESSKPPTVTETLRPLKQEEVSEPSVNTYDSERLFEDTHTKECEQKAEHIETTVEKTDLGEQEKNLQSTEKAMVTNQPQEEKGVAIKTEELEELKSTETPTLDVQASDSIQRMSQREMTKEELIQLEHSCDEKTVTDNHSGKEEDNDQDVWQDAMEDILTPEESDLAHSELQDKKEVEFEMSLVYTIEDEEMHELPKIQEKGDTESEGEDFDVALEQLDISRCY